MIQANGNDEKDRGPAPVEDQATENSRRISGRANRTQVLEDHGRKNVSKQVKISRVQRNGQDP